MDQSERARLRDYATEGRALPRQSVLDLLDEVDRLDAKLFAAGQALVNEQLEVVRLTEVKDEWEETARTARMWQKRAEADLAELRAGVEALADPHGPNYTLQTIQSHLRALLSDTTTCECQCTCTNATHHWKSCPLSDTTTECGDYPAPCNHDPAHVRPLTGDRAMGDGSSGGG